GSTINPVDRDRDAACLMGSGNVSPFAASFAGMRLLSEICQKKSTPCGTQKIGVRYKSFDVNWSQWSGLNRRPTVYESVALPLSYIGFLHFETNQVTFILFRSESMASQFAVPTAAKEGLA